MTQQDIAELIRVKCDERDWDKLDLELLSGLSASKVEALFSGKCRIHQVEANALSQVFMRPAQFWLNLQAMVE